MSLIACPECGKSVSSEAPNCPSCGYPIKPIPTPTPAKMTGLWWGLGCLLGVPALLTVVAVVGVLAAIAIPNFVRARETSQFGVCMNNMRQIEDAKRSWALASNASPGAEADMAGINAFLKGAIAPACPVGGKYAYGPVGQSPECSKHGVLGATAAPLKASMGRRQYD
jgi:hypothetical protein